MVFITFACNTVWKLFWDHSWFHFVSNDTSIIRSFKVCIIYIQYSIAQWQNLADQMSNIDMILFLYLSLLHGLLNCVYCGRVTETCKKK